MFYYCNIWLHTIRFLLIPQQSQIEEEFRMNTLTKILILAIVVTLGHLGNAPSAVAITISIAEVRGDVAFVKGREADWKQQIFWEDDPDPVTTANGGGGALQF